VRARAGRALREALTLSAVLIVMLVVAVLFLVPWLPRPTPGGDWIATYVPLTDGDARLMLRRDGQGSTVGWMAQNTRLIAGLRVYTDLRKTIADGFLAAARLPGEETIPDGEVSTRLNQMNIIEVRTYDLGPDGEVAESWQYVSRDERGDRLVGLHYPQTDRDLTLDPPALTFPSEAKVGDTWHSEGKLGNGQYVLDGRLVSAGPYAGAAGQFEDCIQIESTFLIVTPNARTENPTRDWYCADLGWVEGQTLEADGTVKQRTVWLGANGALSPGTPLPPAQPAAESKHEPSTPDRWRMTRLGRTRATGETSEATILPTWISTDPPLVLGAGFGGDLVAFETFTPGAPARWRFHTGGTVYGQPAYDPKHGRIYFGSSDKNLYALDTRGLFLWSFMTEDNVAARPLVVSDLPGDDLVIAASEDGVVYALDAATGAARWTFEAGDGIVSWPALIDSTVVVGADDAQVYGLDPATGDLLWTYHAGGAVEAPVVADTTGDTVYVASRDGTLAAFKPADCAAECDELWSVGPGGSLRSAPLPVEDRVLVIDQDGQLIAVNAEDGKRLWALSGGQFVGSPILVGDAVLVATYRGLVERISLDGERLGQWCSRSAWNPADGEPSFTYGPVLGGDSVWVADSNAVVRRLGAPPLGEIPGLTLAWMDQSTRPPFVSSQFRSTVAEHDGKAVVVDYTRGVYLLDPATGNGSRFADLPGEGLVSQIDPLVVGDTLLAITGRTLQALGLRTGQILWQGTAPGTSVRPPVVVGQTVLWVTGGDPSASLLALDLASGTMRWQAGLGSLTQVGGVVAGGGSAYTSTPPAAWDLGTGAPRWRTSLDGVSLGGPALAPDGESLFVGGIAADNEHGNVTALDASTGAVRWEVNLDDAVMNPLDQLWAVEDLVVVPDISGKVIVLDAQTGAERWRFTPPINRLGNITVARGQVWLMLENARLYGLDLHGGKPTARLTDLEMGLNGQGLTQRPSFVGDRLIFPAGLVMVGLTLPEAAP
jgi:outer membrane protein assembly factor BamB